MGNKDSIEWVFSRQCVSINFENGKVNYFSVSTQHKTADTLKDAIDDILKCDAAFVGKSPISYLINQIESKGVPDYVDGCN